MRRQICSLILGASLLTGMLHAQVPQLVNYQGRIAVDGVNFEGAGQFKFAFVTGDGSFTLWSNDGTSNGGSEPTAAVTLTVSNGLYSVLLGDTMLSNMIPIPANTFTDPDVRLRVWFNDGVNGSQLLTPDQRLAPAAYIADGAVTTGAIAPGSVAGTSVAPGSLTGTHLAAGSLNFSLLNVPSAPNPGQFLGFDGSSFVWQNAAAGNSVFSLNGTSAYYNAGNVGLGTSNPQSKLHLLGSADALRLTGSHPFLTLDDTAFGLYSRIEGDGAGLNLKTQGAVTGSNPSGLLHLDGVGNVGIGTTTPGTKLEVKTPTGVSGFTHTDGTRTVGSYVGGSASGADGGWLGTISNHPLHFFVNNGQPAVTVTTNGNITQPADKGGFAKAMAVIDYNVSQNVSNCFNSQQSGSAMSTAPCGITVTRDGSNGIWKIDFHFPVRDRFFSITPGRNFPFRIIPDYEFPAGYSNTQVRVFTYLGDTSEPFDSIFTIIVY